MHKKVAQTHTHICIFLISKAVYVYYENLELQEFKRKK